MEKAAGTEAEATRSGPNGGFAELGIAVAASLALAIGTDYPEQMPLQHSATALLAGYLAIQIARRAIDRISLRCLLAFMLLHAFAARWIYSYVPYDHWIQAASGWTLSEKMGFRRNHFDRFVHFAYGALLVPHMSALFWRVVGRRWAARYLAIEFVAASSVVYELFEWALTVFLSPTDVENYNGQQGDAWDPHKDMLLAIVGAAFAVAVACARSGMGRNPRTRRTLDG